MTEVEFSSHLKVETPLKKVVCPGRIYVYNCLPCFKHQTGYHGDHPTRSWPLSIFNQLGVAVANLHESGFPYWLWATIHMLVQVHLQVLLPPHGSHGYMNRQSVGHSFFLLIY